MDLLLVTIGQAAGDKSRIVVADFVIIVALGTIVWIVDMIVYIVVETDVDMIVEVVDVPTGGMVADDMMIECVVVN